MMTMASLFDGSGGFPLASKLCGIEPIWASEIEPFPIMVTRNRFPNMIHYGDVSKINGAEVPAVDIITFGSPCQDLSIAGKRSGLDGERSGLFHPALRIIKEMREATNGEKPKYIVWENVTGAFSSNKGEDFRAVLEGIIGIKDAGVSVPRPNKWLHAGLVMGRAYSVAWRVLDAQFWGVPQRRKRIFLVADFAGGGAGKILFESEGMRGNTAESLDPWQRLTRGTQTSTYESNRRGGTEPDGNENAENTRGQRRGGEKGALIQNELSATLSCNNDQTLFVDVYNLTEGGVAPTITTATGISNASGAKVYGFDRAAYNQGKNAQFDFAVDEELAQTIIAKGPGGVVAPSEPYAGEISKE